MQEKKDREEVENQSGRDEDVEKVKNEKEEVEEEEEEEEEEETEKIATDPLVFSREAFDSGTQHCTIYLSSLTLLSVCLSVSFSQPLLTCSCLHHSLFLLPHSALSQAGKHMEDSVLASYAALLLGLLTQHNPVRMT